MGDNGRFMRKGTGNGRFMRRATTAVSCGIALRRWKLSRGGALLALACGTARKWLRGPRGVGFLYACTATLADADRGGVLLGEPVMLDHAAATWSSPSAYAVLPDA